MGLTLTTPPAEEPVSVAEAKAQLRLDGDEEAELLTALIAGARAVAETVTGRALVAQGWTWSLDCWAEAGGDGADWAPCPRRRPCGRLAVELPKPPLIAVQSVTTYDADGAWAVWDPAAYYVDRAGAPGRIVRLRGTPWPEPGRAAAGIEVAFTAGYGAAADVPAAVRRAILLLVAHWFENREPVPPRTLGAPLPAGVYGLLAPFRVLRV